MSRYWAQASSYIEGIRAQTTGRCACGKSALNIVNYKLINSKDFNSSWLSLLN